MVSGKKTNDMSNGTTKQQNMSFSKKDMSGGSGRNSSSQNGTFRTDGAISGAKNQGERVLQKFQFDDSIGPNDGLGSLESSHGTAGWDQFAENERRFGLKTDYNEDIYTHQINKNHPQYKQRLAEADRKAREIEGSATSNSHVAEERVRDNLNAGDGLDEEDKYSGVRKQDFPPLSSSNGPKYTPPARRAPTGQATVSGAPVDPAIISSQLARPDKPAADGKGKPAPVPKVSKPENATPAAATESSNTEKTETKPTASSSSKTPTAAIRTASPQAPADGVPNATATVERDVSQAFKGFAAQQRKNVNDARSAKARNDKEIKLNDLKKFADSFKLNTPVPSDLVSIIAKDPEKQKQIQEKAKRNAEEAKVNPSEAVKPIMGVADVKSSQRTAGNLQGSSSNVPGRQNPNRNSAFPSSQGQQSFRNDRSSQAQQGIPGQQNRNQPGNLTARLRQLDLNKQPAQIPNSHERLPPTGPSNLNDNFSRRSSGVASAQGGRLNPNSTEFRPSPHAATFNPNGIPSSTSSPRSTATLVENATPPAPRMQVLLTRKPVPENERKSIKGAFNGLEHIISIKPGQGRDWKGTGGIKPAYDTHLTWKDIAQDEKPDSLMHLTYPKFFDRQPYPAQTLSPPNPSHVIPQVPHQHQLPFHLQQGMHRQSPRQPPMNMQHGHGPNPAFGGPSDQQMMASHSQQSFSSPRLPSVPTYSPMNQPAQLYGPGMMPFQGAPPMQPQFRSLSQSHQQFMPQQTHMGPIMMQNPANGFMAAGGMAPGPQMMYPQNGQGNFMPPGNGQPVMPGVNGYPSPGRGAPMMMSQGSQQGHQQPMYAMNPGMSPGPQFGNVAPIYAQQSPGQMPMRGYNGPNQFGTSPQQAHHFSPQQHRNNHQNGNYNNTKAFQQHGPPNGSPNNHTPAATQPRAAESVEETK